MEFSAIVRRRHIDLIQNLFHPPNLPTLQTDLDAVRVSRRIRQNIFDDAFGQFPGSLVFLLHNRNP